MECDPNESTNRARYTADDQRPDRWPSSAALLAAAVRADRAERLARELEAQLESSEKQWRERLDGLEDAQDRTASAEARANVAERRVRALEREVEDFRAELRDRAIVLEAVQADCNAELERRRAAEARAPRDRLALFGSTTIVFPLDYK